MKVEVTWNFSLWWKCSISWQQRWLHDYMHLSKLKIRWILFYVNYTSIKGIFKSCLENVIKLLRKVLSSLARKVRESFRKRWDLNWISSQNNFKVCKYKTQHLSSHILHCSLGEMASLITKEMLHKRKFREMDN